jgi:hypothetical protein
MIAGGSKNVHAAGTSDAVAPLKSRSSTALRAYTTPKHTHAHRRLRELIFAPQADRRTTMPVVRRRCEGAPA